MSCCPPNAHKYLAPDYTSTGRVRGVEFYEIGSTSSKKAILLIPDIFGWNGGRTRNIADFLSGQGYYVVIPKLLTPSPDGQGTDGDGFLTLDFSTFKEKMSKFPYEEVLKPKIDECFAHFQRSGIEKVGLLGFCWGGWVTCHILASGADYVHMVESQVIAHPSVTLEGMIFERNTLHLIERVNKPTLFMPAKGDPDDYREGGAFIETIRSKYPSSMTIDFPNEDHGFVPRANLSNEDSRVAVDRALTETVNFFDKHF